MTLAELHPGDKAIIVRVSGYGGFRKRLVEMGFIKGRVIEVLKQAPLQDPVEYLIMDYHVTLRRSEAKQIEVISLEEAARIASEHLEENYNGTLTEEDIRQVALDRSKEITVALIGNPNAGKTSLFNLLSGQHERVGNYSGVTVSAKEGSFEYRNYHFKLIDLPGTYSLGAFSPEERLVRQQLVNDHPDVVLNVVDAANLERNLFLTTQLIDMNVRSVMALNMYDEMQTRGDKLNLEQLSELLGMPIVPTVASRAQGVEKLFDTIIELVEGGDIVDDEGHLLPHVESDSLLDKHHHAISLEHKHRKADGKSDLTIGANYYRVHRHIHINYGKELEKKIAQLKALIIQNADARSTYTPRYIAIRLLEHDIDIENYISEYPNAEKILTLRNQAEEELKKMYHESAETLITDAKYGFIAGALKETYRPSKKKSKAASASDKIDRVVTNRWLGYPIFLLILFIMFQATFTLGNYPMEWMEMGIEYLSEWLRSLLPNGMFKDLLIDGIVGGVGGVIVFLPNILILYFFITLLESTGYMARAAFIMDKIMHRIGLHGRSFIPLIMGFGCNVPAIMATRTIENRNARMVTILISPLMSCSARLPVYLLFAGTFFPGHAGLVLFGIYMVGVALAAIMARLFKRFIFVKDETPFVMELPPYRKPGVKMLLRDSWEKGEQYLRKIGTTILVASIIIWALSYFPQMPESENGELETAELISLQQEQSYLGHIGKFIEPVMRPLGFEWKSSMALVTGMAAKEVVVSTLAVLYQADEEDPSMNLATRLKSEVRPDGTPAFTPAIALSFMLFVLIYFPCIATIATIKHETGSWVWGIFAAIYTIALAWIISFCAYQIANHGWWQQALVGLLVLYALIKVAQNILKRKKKPTACSSCSGCDLKDISSSCNDIRKK